MVKWCNCPVWNQLITDFLQTETGQSLKEKVAKDRSNKDLTVYPLPAHVFRAFQLTEFDKVKVVILGQDPYHNGVADGLAFSVNHPKPSPSLRVIMEEVMRTEFPNSPIEFVFKKNSLESWAEQGVLLLNTALTVLSGSAGSHKNIGWEDLVVQVLQKLQDKDHGIVAMLWGKEAQKFSAYFRETDLVLKTNHPQAQNYNPNMKFVGCNHFKLANEYIVLESKKRQSRKQLLQINWSTLN